MLDNKGAVGDHECFHGAYVLARAKSLQCAKNTNNAIKDKTDLKRDLCALQE